MTDSGSFDVGDIIYGADAQALYDQVVAKCGLAGVSGPSQARTAHAAGQTISVANINDLVAAYQRAWDASANKPGTQQAQVSAGGLICGALLQNMWTQLGQMTFGDFIPDADTFVCAMSSASGDEVGSGLGLSGTAATIAMYDWGAASGSPASRVVNSTAAYMEIRHEPYNASIGAGSAWSFIMRLKGVGAPTNPKWLGFNISGGYNTLVKMHGGTLSDQRFYVANSSSVLIQGNVSPDLTATGDSWLVFDSNGSEIVCGYCTAGKPTKKSDLTQYLTYTGSGSGFSLPSSSHKVLGQYGSWTGLGAYYIVLARKSLINHSA